MKDKYASINRFFIVKTVNFNTKRNMKAFICNLVAFITGVNFMGYGGKPYWVSKRDEAIRDMMHSDSERQSFDRIRELEKENDELKKENLELKREIADLKQRLKDFDKPIRRKVTKKRNRHRLFSFITRLLTGFHITLRVTRTISPFIKGGL
jgi:cell division protein FtsB